MSQATLLIVEDEAIVAADLAGKLRRLGYQVAATAASGAQAVELACRHQPDLVLMDIWLEGPMDGIEAAEEIRRHADVPVIYLTAHSDAATLSRAKLTGPFGYILKPFDERELHTQIEMALYKHQADRQLRQQREWLRVTLTSIGDAVVATDAEGRIVFTNAVAESLSGWRAEEAAGLPVQDVFRMVNEQTGRPLEDPVARVLAEGRAVELSNHAALVTRDGRTVPIEDSAAPILDAAGRVIGTVLVFHDVTEKRRAQEALAASEQRHRALFETMTEGFALHEIIADEQGKPCDFRFLDVNPAFERLTGLKRDGVIGRRVLEVLPNTEGHWIEAYGRVVTTGEPLHMENYSAELDRWYEVLAYRTAPGQFAVAFSDVTDRKRTEQRLRKEHGEADLANRILRAFMEDNSAEPFDKALSVLLEGTGSRQGVFGYVSEPGHLFCPSLSKVLDECEVAGKCIHYPPEKWKGLWARALREKRSFYTNQPPRVPPGHVPIDNNLAVPILFQGSAIGLINLANKDGGYGQEDRELAEGIAARIAAVLYAWIQKDQREQDRLAAQQLQIRTEQALRQANADLDRRVSERTAELLRTVDTLQGEVRRRISAEEALRGRSEQLRALASELTLAEQRERRRLAEVLHDNLQQLLVGAKLRLTLLDRSRDPAVKQSVDDVQDLLDESIECSRSLTGELSPPILHQGGLVPALEWLAVWMQQKHALTVELQTDEDAAPQSEDMKVLLFQSARELLFNTVKHAKAHKARVCLERSDDHVKLTVSDEGAGFDPAAASPKAGKGGGFGLFSIRERLDLLGGRLEIDSAPGRGSRFRMVAPLGPPRRPADPGPATLADVRISRVAAGAGAATPGGQAQTKIRLLLVDDHVVVRQGLSRLLREEPDMEIVAEASDGQTAVDLARRLTPDVVMMDISMPGMDGIEATRIIHAEMPQVRVIGLSMFEEGELAAKMRQAGAVDYLTKSGPADALLKAIRARTAAGRSR